MTNEPTSPPGAATAAIWALLIRTQLDPDLGQALIGTADYRLLIEAVADAAARTPEALALDLMSLRVPAAHRRWATMPLLRRRVLMLEAAMTAAGLTPPAAETELPETVPPPMVAVLGANEPATTATAAGEWYPPGVWDLANRPRRADAG